MSTEDKVRLGILGFYFSLVGFVISGWIINLLFLVRLESFDVTFSNIVRIIGVVMPPIGAICGWFL